MAWSPAKAPCRNSVVMNDADVQPELGPQRLVVRLEHGPLDAVVDADPQHDRCPADGHVQPFGI